MQSYIDSVLTVIKQTKNKLNSEAFTVLANQIVGAIQFFPGDGDVIEVEDNTGRLLQGNLGNKLNRIEDIITNNSDLTQQDKDLIIESIEKVRLEAGQQMIEKDKEIAAQIRQRFL